MNSRLFVGGLAAEVTEKDLFDLFMDVDEVDQVSIIKDRATQTSRGFGFVEMRTPKGAEAAIERLHGLAFHGRALKVAVAKPSKKWAEGKQRKVEVTTIGTGPGRSAPAGGDDPPPRPPTLDPVIEGVATTEDLTRFAAELFGDPRGRGTRAIPWLLAISTAVMALGVVLYLRSERRPLPPPDPTAVLVMPVEVLGQSEAAEYLSYAFAQSLAVNLATVKELRVLPVPQVSESILEESAARVARERGAGKLVSCTLTNDPTQTRISITLVDTIEDRILWGTQVQVTKTELPTIAERLAVEIAGQLGAVVPALYAPVTELTGGPVMADSPQLAAALGAIRRGEVEEALATTKDLAASFPKEPAALTLRAHALVLRWDAERSRVNFQSLKAGLAALDATGRGYPYADFYGAYILYNEGKYREAIERFTRLIEGGDLSPAGRGWVLRYRAFGRQRSSDLDGALADLHESLRLDPANPWTLGILSGVLLEAGQAEEASRRAKQALALLPSNWRNHQAYGEALTALGRLPEAAEAFGRACELSQTQSPCTGHGLLLLKIGDKGRAAAVIERALTLPDTAYGAYNLACYHTLSGDRAAAITYLDRSVELGMVDAIIETDPDLALLHGDEAYERLVRVVEQRIAANCHGPDCPAPR